MWKKENLRKNFLRVKQIADQNLGRAEKSEVLSEDLQSVEKRVELVKHVCQNTTKRLGASLQTTGGDVEKRLKKLPEANLAHCMVESANLLGPDTIMGLLFQLCGECQNLCAKEMLQYEIDVNVNVLNPLQDIIDKDVPQLAKLRKQLNKVTLDMDSAKSRWCSAVRQTQTHGTNVSASAKADIVKEEYEEALNRVEQAKDLLATELFIFVSREAEHSSKLLALLEAQCTYHKNALEAIEKLLPKMRSSLDTNQSKPLYGLALEEHLRVTDRDVALVIEACVCTLLEAGMEEEGLFRIAGMASKVKKLKASFDANIVDLEEFATDLHSVAGALKQYLRELPEPLLTFKLYSEFLKAAQVHPDQRLQALHDTVEKLPRPNYNNFRYLIKFLAKLTDKSDVNKMTPNNIGIVIGPNLLWSEGDCGPNMLTSGTVSSILETCVTHAGWFFPGELDFGSGSFSSQSSSPALSERPKSEYVVTERDTISFSSTRLQSQRDSLSDATPPSQAQSQTQVQENPSVPQTLNVAASHSSKVTSMSSPPPPPPSPGPGGDNYGQAANSFSLAPLAQSEQVSPKFPRRISKKPAPPPPLERPFNIAITASVAKSANLSQTWPRQAVGPLQQDEDNSGYTEVKKQHSPPSRPAVPPDKPVLNPDRTSGDRSTLPSINADDRSNGSPPERPKFPPPLAPQHQRSASMGAPVSAAPSNTLSADDKGSSSRTCSNDSLNKGVGMTLTNSNLPVTPDKSSNSNSINRQSSNARPARPTPPPPPPPVKIIEETHL